MVISSHSDRERNHCLGLLPSIAFFQTLTACEQYPLKGLFEYNHNSFLIVFLYNRTLSKKVFDFHSMNMKKERTYHINPLYDLTI